MRFVVITAPRQGGISRIGITASKRVGGAVVRNRIKRLVREFFRRHQHGLTPPRDVLVIARPAAADATYVAVREELSAALGINAAE
jgi:ribonuclease P protein component